jgi:hypothetical protein
MWISGKNDVAPAAWKRGRSMTTKGDVPRIETEAELSEQLRAMFDEIADQPVPSKLLDLVEALEEKRRYQEEPPLDEF